ncbi:MAG: M67 family metallopeptidase [Candidatus Dormibacteria bacterium]|jgi:proteasome lid subunit RPN8/RPN11
MTAKAAPVLLLRPGSLALMRRFAEAAYPHEGCGVLVGVPDEHQVEVTLVLEGHNLVQDRRQDRYELDPGDIVLAERRACELGQEVVGFYHTHPDHVARPSQLDTDRAWPGYHYVVLAVEGGELAAATAWRIVEGEEPSRFEQTSMAEVPSLRGYNPPDLVAEAW